MSEHYIIDRMTASELFEGLMARRLPQSILWLEGQGNMGKSHLLDNFQRRCKQPDILAHVAYIQMELIQDISDLLNGIDRLLGVVQFAQYDEAVQRQAAAPLVNINEAKIQRSQVVMDAKPDPELVKTRRLALTKALVSDLHGMAQESDRPITILFDAFDQAPPMIQTWLQEEFLGRLSQIDGLCVVVACRNAPNTRPDWDDDCYHHVLEPVSVEDFHAYWQYKQVALGAEHVPVLHQALGGIPGEFVNAVRRLSADSGGRA